MATVLSQIGSIVGGNLFDGLSHLIDSIKGKNPEDAARLQELQLKYTVDIKNADLQLQLAQLQAATQQDTTAGQNIRAEITSPDPVVRRARAMPLWVGSAVIVVNYICLPFAHIWVNFQPLELPTWFWYMYIFAIAGYVGHSAIDRALGGSGGDLSFLGLKFNSKGD